jgi:hypothetical protein
MSSYHYKAFGFAFESEIELPGVEAASPDDEPVVSIRYGDTPERIDAQGGDSGGYFEATPDRFLLKMGGVGRYLIREGREIIVQPEGEEDPQSTRLFLMGSAFGALLFQRGLMPLHASAVRLDDQCIAFTGPSGIGKSTLSAFFDQQGRPIHCDDVCAVSVCPDRGVIAWPGFRKVKLWEDAFESLGIPYDPETRIFPGVSKYEIRLTDSPGGDPLPLRSFYVLSDADEESQEGIIPMQGAGKVMTIMENVYRWEFLKDMGLSGWHFQTAAKIATTLRVAKVVRRRGMERIPEVMEWMENDE